VAFQNINGFRANSSDEKVQKIQAFCQQLKVDAFGIQEVNLHLSQLGHQGVWSERTLAFEGYSHCATNIHSRSTVRRLFGGTALFMPFHTSHRAISHGQDLTGLGRWCWTRLRGKRGLHTRIVTAYRPTTPSTNSDDALTVFAQHEAYFRGTRNPREAFLEDLSAMIQQWTTEGDQIILGGDFNQDTCADTLVNWRETAGLIDAHRELFPDLPTVATCRSNSNQQQIDALWTSPGLDLIDGGFTGFQEYDMGSADHRILWIDISDESIYGFQAPPPAKRPNDGIPLHDPRIVDRYNALVLKQHKAHRFTEKVSRLEATATQQAWTDADSIEYEQLCIMDNGIRRQARRRCRQFFAGQVPYSDVIANDRDEIHLWNMIVAYKSNKRTDTRAIRRLIQRLKIPNALQSTLDEAVKSRKLCYSKYRRHKKDSTALRASFLSTLAQRRATRLGTTLAAQQKILQVNKRSKWQFKTINRILGNKQRISVSIVEIKEADDTVTQCVTRKDIEDACMREGQRRFLQASNTPFLLEPLLHDIGFSAKQTTVDQILTGTYHIPDGVDEYTTKFIAELTMPSSIAALPTISGIVSTAEHVQSWKRMKGHTASSTFGPQFSDYIAGTHNINVADVDAALASIPIAAGYCPQAWQQAIDVMIPKKKLSSEVEKLRIIVLFHALFNMTNKRVGRTMVYRANDLQLLPAETFGSRPGRCANICALNKVLTYDVSRQRKRPMALCSNDATACYDRIVHSVASVCMQRLGVDARTCQVMFGTLQQIKHHVATAYGTSSTPYGGLEIPLHGIGQGNGAGPAIWLVMTIPLINMLRTAGFGFRSRTPITHHPYRFACYTFVDDTDTVHCCSDRTTPYTQVVSEMQNALDHWEGGLHATGGALSAAKSYWYLVDFEWRPRSQTWHYASIATRPGDLHIHRVGTQPTPTILKRLEASQAEETLGLWIAPDGNQERQILALTSKIKRWCDKVRCGQLPISLAWLSLTSGLAKSLEYPLAATTLTMKQCKTIEKSLLDTALPALGLPRRLPRAILFAPKTFLGFGFPDLWFLQAYHHIGACLEYGDAPDTNPTGALLRETSEHLRIELGLPNSPFGYDYATFHKCTTPCYLHTVWEFCSRSGFELKDGLPPTPISRDGDIFIMEAFSLLQFSAAQLRILNKCRIYLQVELLSDMSTGDGVALHPGSLEQHEPRSNRDDYDWPFQPKPNNTAWSMWRNALVTAFLQVQPNTLSLRQHLHSWRRIPPCWKWFFDASTNTLYERTNTTEWKQYKVQHRHRTRRNQSFIAVNDVCTVLPPNAIPTTVTGRGNSRRHTGTANVHLFDPEPEDKWWGVIIEHPDNFDALIQGIQNHTAVCVTDGSYKDDLGTAAFVILPDINATEDPFTCVNCTPGLPVDLDAYRAELGGIYGSIATVNMLASAFHVQNGGITLGCDCLSAIHTILKHSNPSPKTASYDLITAIRSLLRKSTITWTFEHIAGHQDDHIAYTHLDRWGQLNVDMDQLAKAHWQALDNNRPNPFFLPPTDGQWSIWHSLCRLSRWHPDKSSTLYHNQALMMYWYKRLKINQSTDNIHWNALARGYRRLPVFMRLWLPKWHASLLPIGYNFIRWNKPNLDKCPRCGNTEDHRYHIIQCPHPGARRTVTNALDQLDTLLTGVCTAPDIRDTILSLYEAAATNEPWTPPCTNNHLLGQAVAEQSLLGYQRILDGFIVCSFGNAQHEYYISINRATTGLIWASKVVHKIWQIAWDLWLHRRRIRDTPADFNVGDRHLALDDAIRHEFSRFPNTHPHRQSRWFSRTPSDLEQESIDWKERWLDIVRTLAPLD
jgi:exonuclease III